MRYNRYCVNGLEDRKKSVIFTRLMDAVSDSFSLIYYSRNGFSLHHPGMLLLKARLKRCMISSAYVNQWPGTEVIDNGRDHYLMVTYDTKKGYIPELELPKTVFDWNYPKYPMDLCFYKNGLILFETTAHEMRSVLYLPEDAGFPTVDDIESFGITLEADGSISEEKMFRLPLQLTKTI